MIEIRGGLLKILIVFLLISGLISVSTGFKETYLDIENESKIFHNNESLYQANQEIPEFANVQHSIRVKETKIVSSLRILLKTNLPFPLELRPSSEKITSWKIYKGEEKILEKKIVDNSTYKRVNGSKEDVIRVRSVFPKTDHCSLEIPILNYRLSDPPIHPYPFQNCRVIVESPTLPNHTFRSTIHLPEHRVSSGETELKSYNRRIIDNSIFNTSSNTTKGYCHVRETEIIAEKRQTTSNTNKKIILDLEGVNDDVLLAKKAYNCENFYKKPESSGPTLVLEYTPDRLSKSSFYLFSFFFLATGIFYRAKNNLEDNFYNRYNISILALFVAISGYYLYFNNPEKATTVFLTPIFMLVGFLSVPCYQSLKRKIESRWNATERHNLKRKLRNKVLNEQLTTVVLATILLTSTFSVWSLYNSRSEKELYQTRNMTFEASPKWAVDMNETSGQNYSTSFVNDDSQEMISLSYEPAEINASNTTAYINQPLEYFREEKEETTSNVSKENLTSFYYSYAPPTQKIRITDNETTKNFFVFNRHIEIGNKSDFTDVRSIIFATVHRGKELKFIYTLSQEDPINKTQREQAFSLFKNLKLKILVNKSVREPLIGDSKPIS